MQINGGKILSRKDWIKQKNYTIVFGRKFIENILYFFAFLPFDDIFFEILKHDLMTDWNVGMVEI